jgi:excisionase family DNA binding protein
MTVKASEPMNQPMHHVLLDQPVYRPLEFGKLVGVSVVTVVNWVKAGKLKGHKIGGRYYVVASELAKLKNAVAG